MSLQARQSLLGTVYFGDKWAQFVGYASSSLALPAEGVRQYANWTRSLGLVAEAQSGAEDHDASAEASDSDLGHARSDLANGLAPPFTRMS